jgi:transcription elongation factor Elf1
MFQATSRRHLTAEMRVRSQVIQCGICGKQMGTRIVFSRNTALRYSTVITIPP